MQLHECPGCARHVRVGTRVCPFCEHALPASFGLSRAGVLLVGTAAITALAACPQRRATKYGGPPPPEPAMDQPVDVEPELEEPSEPEEPSEAPIDELNAPGQ
ncbi:MAG: hypothetical protein AAF799_35240 [Myxococcota bacterium]